MEPNCSACGGTRLVIKWNDHIDSLCDSDWHPVNQRLGKSPLLEHWEPGDEEFDSLEALVFSAMTYAARCGMVVDFPNRVELYDRMSAAGRHLVDLLRAHKEDLL